MQTRSTYRLPCVEEIVEGGRGRLGGMMAGKMGTTGTKAKDVYVTQFSDRLAPGGRFSSSSPSFVMLPLSLYICQVTNASQERYTKFPSPRAPNRDFVLA